MIVGGAALAALFVQQVILENASSYKDDPKDIVVGAAKNTATSMFPYAPQILGLSGYGEGRPYPASAVKDMKKSIEYLKEGDIASAFGEFAKNWVRFGAQANRAIATDRKIKEGTLTEESRLEGSAFGWYFTEEGAEYLRKMKQYDSGDTEYIAPASRGRGGRGRTSGRGR